MNTGNYTKLEIFARATEEGGGVRVVSGKGDCRESGGSAYYRWIRMPVEKDTEYEILCEGCQISLCYLSGCENILDKGVCYLEQKNGLCWFQGDYHMFYQFNPHGQKWSHMYWGHAASKELIHWTHLPVVLEPQREILDHPEKLAGGAFSGSAVVRGEEVVFFLTRSLGPCNDDENTVQQQWVMRSRDMLHFTQEELVIGALMQHRVS